MADILIVEDDEEIREMISDYLSLNQNHNVEEAADGEEGLEKADFCLFDIILTDLNMPNMNGLELSAFVRATTINHDTPIVVISGNLDAQKTEKFQKLGMIDILHKPVDIDQLSSTVNRLSKVGKVERAATVNPNWVFKHLKSSLEKAASTLELHIPKFEELQDGSSYKIKENLASGIIPLYGVKHYGSFAISFSEDLLQEFGQSLFNSKQPMLIETCFPIAAEMANQLAGGYKRQVEQEGVICSIGVPSLATGLNHNVNHCISGEVFTMEFKINNKTGWISYCQGKEALAESDPQSKEDAA